MRAAAMFFVAPALSTAVLLADDHSVIFDEDVDFSTLSTFTMRDVRMSSDRPEIDNVLFAKRLTKKLPEDAKKLIAKYKGASD